MLLAVPFGIDSGQWTLSDWLTKQPPPPWTPYHVTFIESFRQSQVKPVLKVVLRVQFKIILPSSSCSSKKFTYRKSIIISCISILNISLIGFRTRRIVLIFPLKKFIVMRLLKLFTSFFKIQVISGAVEKVVLAPENKKWGIVGSWHYYCSVLICMALLLLCFDM